MAERGHDSDRTSERRRPPIWLSCREIIVASAVALAWQVRVAGQLKREIGGLQQELRETLRVLLGAHRSLGWPRFVPGFTTWQRLEGLRVLVDADPGMSPLRTPLPCPVDNPGASIPARLPAE